MNKSVFLIEGLKFISSITIKEKLDEYDAPPWSPDIDKLSPIKKSITPFRKTFASCTEVESFDTCKLEFRSPDLTVTEETHTEPLPDQSEKISLPPTPEVRKPMNVIMSSIRRIDFDLPEDYELEVKSVNVENNDIDIIINETVV